jgi:hypothetical protein
LVLGILAFCSYTFQVIASYVFPQQAQVWTIKGHVSTDKALEHSDDLVFSSNPATGEDDPKDNSFTVKVVVQRNTDGSLAFPKLHIGRVPEEQFSARTIHLDSRDNMSDTDESYPLESNQNKQEIWIKKPIDLTSVPTYNGSGPPPVPLASPTPGSPISQNDH